MTRHHPDGPMVTTSLRMPATTLASLRAEAERRGVNVSALLRAWSEANDADLRPAAVSAVSGIPAAAEVLDLCADWPLSRIQRLFRAFGYRFEVALDTDAEVTR